MNRRIAPISPVALVGLILAVASLPAKTARADVSSWMAFDVGAHQLNKVGLHREVVPSLRLSTGMGTDPSHDWIVGGLLRSETLFGSGTDLSMVLRLADHGFANGEWGLALDAGPLARWWGINAYGVTSALTVGGPWGLEAGLQATLGEERVRTYGCFFGIDLARLTVLRRSGSSYWENPFPVYRPESESPNQQ